MPDQEIEDQTTILKKGRPKASLKQQTLFILIATALIPVIIVNFISFQISQTFIEKTVKAELLMATAEDDNSKAEIVAIDGMNRLVRDYRTQMFRLYAWAVLLTLVISIVLALILGRHLTRPIAQLRQAMQALSKGTWNLSILPQNSQDFDTLTYTFTIMAQHLHQQIKKLETRGGRRTQLIEASVQVGRYISDISDLETLLNRITNLIQTQFGYTRVQVFLTNDQGYLTTRSSAGIDDTQAEYRPKVGEESLIGQAGLGKIQVANLTGDYIEHNNTAHSLRPTAKLGLPLKQNHSVIGVLYIESKELENFVGEDITLFQMMADQLAIAIRYTRLLQASETARLNTETLLADLQRVSKDARHRSTQLQAASSVSKVASAILNTQELVQQIVDLIQKQFHFYYVGLFLIDETRTWAELKAGTGRAGLKRLTQTYRLELSQSSAISWCINQRKARMINDIMRDEVYQVDKSLPETRAELVLPLISRGNIFGAISIQSQQTNAFAPDDVTTLQAMADQLATALQNAQLYSEAQASRSRYHALYNRTPAGHLTLSNDGAILEINDTQLRILGETKRHRDMIRQSKITDFLVPDSQEKFMALLPKLTQGTPIQNLELVYQQPSGKQLIGLVSALPIFDETHALLEIHVSTQDMTQLKEIEKAREALISETNTLYELGQQLLTVESQAEIYLASINAIKTMKPERGIAILTYKYSQGQLVMELAALWNNPTQEWPPVALGATFPVELLGLEDLLVSGDTITAIDGTQDERFSETLQQLLAYLQIKSLVGTPIWSRGEVIGFVLIGNHTATPFSDNAIRLFDGVSRQMSVSIENLLLLEEAQHRANQLETAAEISKNTTSEIDLTLLLPQTVEIIKEMFGYYHVAIFLVDDYRQYAALHAATDAIGQTLLAEELKVSLDKQNVITAAITQGRVQSAFGIQEKKHFLSHPLLSDTDSEVALPLLVRDTVIGVLDVQNTKTKPFDPADIVVLQTIADQLANAIDIARLFERERRATQEIQDLHRRYLHEEWRTYLGQESSEAKIAVIEANQHKGYTMPEIFNDIAPDVENKGETTNYTQPNNPQYGSDEQKDLAVLATPLRLRGQVIGSLGLVDETLNQWSDDTTSIIEAVSAQAALAIENARLIEKTRDHALQLQTSAKISQVVTALLDPDRLLKEGINLIQSQFHFSHVYFYLIASVSPLEDAIVYKSAESTEQMISPSTGINLDKDSLVGQAVIKKKTITSQKEAVPHLNDTDSSHFDCRSALAIPLWVRQKFIGVLEIHSHLAHAFTQDQITVLKILGFQIVISLENARAYQELQALADRLREVDRLKTQFLANMSHELRTPLNSIIGFSRVILKGIDGPITDMQAVDLTSIHQSGQHLLGLINDILDLAKIEAGKLELSFDEVDLKQVITGVSATANGLVKDKPIAIHQVLPNDFPIISGDVTKIRQILINLISNAAKFTEEGTITIRLTHNSPNEVQIQVIDTGMGIPEEKLESIFDEFTQADASTTRKVGGTGLGLSITKKLVELHKGHIFVESKLSSGSTFTVILPITQPSLNSNSNQSP